MSSWPLLGRATRWVRALVTTQFRSSPDRSCVYSQGRSAREPRVIGTGDTIRMKLRHPVYQHPPIRALCAHAAGHGARRGGRRRVTHVADDLRFSATQPIPELVAGALAGHQAAWNALVERLERVVWKSVNMMTFDHEIRDDAFAATWLRLAERLGTDPRTREAPRLARDHGVQRGAPDPAPAGPHERVVDRLVRGPAAPASATCSTRSRATTASTRRAWCSTSRGGTSGRRSPASTTTAASSSPCWCSPIRRCPTTRPASSSAARSDRSGRHVGDASRR